MSNFRKIFTFRVNDTTPDDHLGRLGEITYRDGFLYFHDGNTPGGEVIGGGGGSGGPTSWSSVTGKPTFATVATSGSYTDLTNKPTLPTKTSDLTNDSGFLTSVSWASVTGKPNLFSGAYADLTGKPTLFSGSYNDLTNKPTIPSLTGYATESYVNTAVSNVINGASGALDTLKELADAMGNDANFASTVTNSLAAKANSEDLATVATTGSYDDLTDKPTIPSLDGYATEAWVSEQGFGTGSSGFSGDYNDLTNKPVISDTTGLTGGDFFIAKDETTLVLGQWAAQTLVFGEQGIILGGTGGVRITGAAGSGVEIGGGSTGGITFSSATSGINYNDLNNLPTIPSLDGYATEAWVNEQGFGSGGSGVSLPANASGYLTNDGAGNLAWAAGDGTFSGDYNDLINKPIPSTTLYDNGKYLTTDGSTLSWGNPFMDPAFQWSGGNGSTLLDQPENNYVALITDTTEASPTFKFRYDGVFQVPGQIYDNNGIPVIDREAKFEYKQSTDFNAAINKRYIVRTETNSVTVTLPSTETLAGGEAIFFADAYNTFSVENPLIITGGYIGDSDSDTYVMDTPASYIGIFNTGNGRWRIYAQGPVVSGDANTGNITFNENTISSDGFGYGYPLIVNHQGSDGGVEIDYIDGEGVQRHAMWLNGEDGLQIRINSNDNSGMQADWLFGPNRRLTLPDGMSSIYSADTGNITLSAPGNIVVNNSSGTWTFGSDAKLTLPEGGDIVDSNGTSVLGGSGSSLEIVAGDGIVVDTVDGVVTISATSNASPQYGYFTELREQSSSNAASGGAVVIDSDGNSYVGYTYYDNNINNDVGGIMKISNTGEQQWAVNIASQNGDARNAQIASLELVTIDGTTSLIALGHYYNNDTNKDVAFIYYINPTNGSINESLANAELIAPGGMNVKDGVAGYDGSNPYVVVVGETYDQTVTKTLTPLAGSTTDKLFVSWADFAASGVSNGESLYYVDGPNQYGVTMNAVGVSASVAGSTDPAWAGISISVSVNEAGNYTVSRVNGWGYLVNSWPNPVTLTVPGADLGGVTGVNDMTFDFSNVAFDNNSNNIQAAISNIQGTPVTGVYCPGWGGNDWSTQIGNALTFNYQLYNQAYIGRFGQSGGWTKNLGGGSYDRLESVVVDSDLNTYAVGYAWNGSRGSLVAKYDYEGGQVWAVYIDPNDNTGNSLMSVDLLSDGNLITVDEDGVVTKLDSSNGDIIWQVKADNGPSWDGDFRGTATPDGDYIITNYEDDDYTQYVMRISGSDGSSVWNKRIRRTYSGDNGEINTDDDTQYIDCNATSLTIAGRSYPPNGDQVGLVFNFPINNENTDGTYGQFVITSESMNWTTKSTTSIAATVNNTDISVTPNETTPTSSASIISANITTMGGEEVASTGDITFEGSKLSSPAPGYPSEFPLGVITLAPGNGSNSEFANYGQFINVYPTVNYDQPHIHIAAGHGNNSNGDLILGDDNYHVDINHNGSIYIKTNGQNYAWTFDDSGNLTLPYGGDIRDANGNSVLSGGGSGTGNTTFSGNGIGNSDNGNVNDMTIAPNWDGQFTGNTYLNLRSNANASSAVELVNNSTGGVNIITQNNATWAFGANGNLTLPAGGDIVDSNGDSVLPAALVRYETKNANFTAVAGETYWVDSTSGTLTVTLPANPTVGDWVALYDGELIWQTNNLTVNGNGNNIRVMNMGGGGPTWATPAGTATLNQPLMSPVGPFAARFVWNGTVWSGAM